MVTLAVVCLPFCSTLTVEAAPFAVIAALGNCSTFDFVATVTLTSAVMPLRTLVGGLISRTVTS